MPDHTPSATTIAPPAQPPAGQRPAPVPPPRTAPTTPNIDTGEPAEHLPAHDLLSPRQLVTRCGRRADELAALVEDALAKEHTTHRAHLVELDRCRSGLDTAHQQRVALLTLLADHLGHVNAMLDDATDQIPAP